MNEGRKDARDGRSKEQGPNLRRLQVDIRADQQDALEQIKRLRNRPKRHIVIQALDDFIKLVKRGKRAI